MAMLPDAKATLIWLDSESDDTEAESNRWVDHTTASSFEETVAKLGRAILHIQEVAEDSPEEEEIVTTIPSSEFVGRILKLRWLRNSHAVTDFKSNEARASLVSRWFGISGPYLILTEGAIEDRVISQKLLSALSVALSNVQSRLPGFVAYQATPIHAPAYLGFDPERQLYFESDVASNGSTPMKLEDSLRLFKATYTEEVNKDQVRARSKRVSVRMTWQMSVDALQVVPALNPKFDSQLISGLRCSAVFPSAPEGALFDNQLFSTISADRSPLWTVLVIWKCRRPSSLQHSGGGSFEETGDKETGQGWMFPRSIGLARLKYLASYHQRRQQTTTSQSGMNNTEFVQSLARRIRQSHQRLREMADTNALNAFANHTSPFTTLVLYLLDHLGSQSAGIKNTSSDVCEITMDDDDFEEAKAIVEATWMSFCRKLRHRFEHKDVSLFQTLSEIDYKKELEPDMSRTLAHQKVALIRFCTREMWSKEQVPAPVKTVVPESVPATEPRGRKRELDYSLCNHPDRKAWEPHTQSVCIWAHRDTEDGRVFETNLRAELLSHGLISDMQAFKAANPGCDFIDFIRWFSPKDVAGDQLNQRMESGVWLQAWASSGEGLEVENQKPLFDPVVVGEKALHWLETLGFEAICEQLTEESLHGLKQYIADSCKEAEGCFEGAPWEALKSSIEHSHDVSGLLGPLSLFEAQFNRIDAVKHLPIPAPLAHLLEKGDGTCSFESTEHPELVKFFLHHINILCGDYSQAEKREYLIGVDDSERLYCSTTFGELRSARVISL